MAASTWPWPRRGAKPEACGRSTSLLIAATALALDLPLYTRNPRGFRGLEDLLDIVSV